MMYSGSEDSVSGGLNRRGFLKILSMLGLAPVVFPKALAGLLSANSRIIIVSDTAATSGSTINAATVQTMIDSGIVSLAQTADIGEAWKILLPGVQATSRIGIKVNCINSSLSTHPQAAKAVAASLQKMIFSGTPFAANNIIIYDRTSYELQAAGYIINTSTSGVRCISTDTSGIGYSTQNYSVSGVSQKISKIVTEMVDYLINLAVLKNHTMSGVTLCLKNHYGTCNDPGSLHNNYCNPYIPALNALDPIKAKQKVFIIDALYGIRSGGPGGSPQFVANKFLFGTDIVATDYQGRKLLKDNGCTTTTTMAAHVDTAATTYQLGTNDPSKMDVVTVVNPSAKTAALTAPNGGENWQAGSLQKIKWNTANIDYVKIEFSSDNGANWTVINNSTAASAGEWEWTVPDSPSQNCKIRISDTTLPLIKDESNAVFTISRLRSVNLIVPNGGEVWEVSSARDINWSVVNVDKVDIDYSVDDGNSWLPVAGSVIGAGGTYRWTIPDNPSAHCKIRIVSTDDKNLLDASDNTFTIKTVSGVSETSGTGDDYELYHNFPNPFNPVTSLHFNIPQDCTVRLDLLDARGGMIRRIADKAFRKGRHTVPLDMRKESSGVYFVRMYAGTYNKTIKISLLK